MSRFGSCDFTVAMDVARSSPASYRVPDAVPLTGVRRADSGGDYSERPIPAGAVIRWTPVGQFAVDPAYPVFIKQHALAAVHAHVATCREDAASLGVLAGAVFVSPDTRTPYIVIESAIDVPGLPGDGEGDLAAALMQGHAVAHEEVRRAGHRLLGWYCGRVAPHARLSVAERQAHLTCFKQPWHVAIIVARGVDLTGGVFRIGPDAAGLDEYLPFYEVPERDSLLPDGREVADVAWTNYRADRVVLSLEGSRPRLLHPGDLEAEEELETEEPSPRWRFLRLPVARAASFGALGIVAVGALVGAYRALASGPSTRPAEEVAQPVSVAAAAAHLDRLADTVAFAVAAFDLRARLFEDRKMVCTDLARGVVSLEERWTAYNAARRVDAATFDSVRTAKDRQLSVDVSAVEGRFMRTGCPRP